MGKIKMQGNCWRTRLLAMLMAMLMLVTSFSPVCAVEEPSQTEKKISCITVEPVTIRVVVGETVSLPTTYVHYEESTEGDVLDTSIPSYAVVSEGEGTIANLENGKIQGVRKGSATLQVCYQAAGDTFEATCAIEVVTKQFVLEKETMTLELGATPATLQAVWEYSDGEKEAVTEELVLTVLEGEDVIEIVDGKIVTKQLGTAKVKVSCGKYSADCGIQVVQTPNTLQLEQTQVNLKVGESFVMQPFYLYADGSREDAKDLSYTVLANASCVELGKQDGEYKAVKSGTVTVRLRSTEKKDKDGNAFEVVCTLNITDVLAESLTLNASNITNLTIGDTYQLTATVKPENVTKPTVSYSVVNSKPLDKNVSKTVLSVDSDTGLVTVKGLGEADIKVTWKSSDGDTTKNKEAICHFYVYQEYFDVTKLGADGTDDKKDSAEIKTALKYATAIANPITVYVPSGTYYLGGVLYIYSNTRLVLAPDAKLVRNQTVDNPMLMSRYSEGATAKTKGYAQCQNIEITGGTWDGNPSGKYYPNNFYIGHAQNVYIHDTKIINNSGAHLIELAGVSGATIENVVLDGFQISSNSKCPVSGQSVKEAIQLDYCSKASAAKFTPHDNTVCQNITIRNCSISNYMCGIGAHGFKSGVYLKDILIEGNTFTNITNCCIDMRNFKNVTIRNNTVSGFHSFVYGYRSTGSIEGNTVINQSYTPITTRYRLYPNGIYLSTSSEFAISGNRISGSMNHGISIASGCKVTIKSNDVTESKKYGIKVENATATIKKNSAKGNGQTRQYYADANAKITADRIEAYYIPLKASYTYTGKKIKPSIKIAKLSKKKYKVTYKKNKKVGTAQVIIKGKGSIKGKVTLTFKIVKKKKKKK